MVIFTQVFVEETGKIWKNKQAYKNSNFVDKAVPG